MPISIAFLVAAVLAALVQLIPGVNLIYFSLFFGDLWPGIFFSLSLAALAYEAWTGRMPRWLLAVPLIWFGGYTAATLLDHLTLAVLRYDFRSKNQAVRLPFDINLHALVVPHDIGESIVRDFRIPAAYHSVSYGHNEKRRGDYRGMRLVDRDICRQLKNDDRITTHGIMDYSAGTGTLDKRVCMLSLYENFTDMPVKVERKTNTKTINWLRVELTELLITWPDGREAKLHSGTASPLMWLPLPAIVCVIPCGYYMSRNRTQITNERDDLANSLQLQPVAPSQRVGADPALIFDLVQKARRGW